MGKSSRGSKGHRAAVTIVSDQDIPVVGMRQPCPCHSGKRYKMCHGRTAGHAEVELVSRPFEGLPGETDWVAMRDIVPSATATVHTNAEYGNHRVTVCTVLPMAWAGLHRPDGTFMVGLQTQTSSGDVSRDIAHAIVQVCNSEPGFSMAAAPLANGPRLQDILDLTQPFEVEVQDDFSFWVAPEELDKPEVQHSLSQANEAAMPTAKLAGLEAAYWCQLPDRTQVRWVLNYDEEEFLNAMGRLHARGESAFDDDSRYLGAFRAHGLSVPVWDIKAKMTADEIQPKVQQFASALAAAVADTSDLSSEERRARAGIVSRQLTVR